MKMDTSWEQELSLLLSLLQRTQNTEKLSGDGNLSSGLPNYTYNGTTNPAERHIHSFIHNVLTPFMSRHGGANSTFLDGKLYAEPAGRGVFFTDGGYNSNGSLKLNGFWTNASGYNSSADGCSSRSYEYADYTQRAPVRDCFVALYVIVIVLSVIGNLMVIYTVWRNKHMRTSTNYYIVNLAVCDFLVGSFVMPLKLLEYVAPCSWQVFGHTALCSIVSFILPVVVFASVLTLVAISIERHRSIMFPLSALRTNNKTRTRCILAFTWIVPLLLASPYLFCQSYAFNIHSQHGSISRQICNDRFDDIDRAMYGGPQYSGMFRKGFFLFLFVSIYLVPMLVIVSTCVRIAKCLLEPIHLDQEEACTNGNMRMTRRREESKRRIAKMVITVALSFIVCWSPFYWMTLVSQVQQESFLRHSNFLFTMLTTHLIGFINSAVNPMIYHAMNERFRKSFRNIFFRAFCCLLPLLKRRRQFSWTTRCDGMSAPYCGYVGSTLNSSNLEPRRDGKLVEDYRFHTKKTNDINRPSRRRPPQRYLVHTPRIVVGECSGNGHFVAKKIAVSEKYGDNVHTNIFADCNPVDKANLSRTSSRTTSNFPLLPQSYNPRHASANQNKATCRQVDYVCTPNRNFQEGELLSPNPIANTPGTHSHSYTKLSLQHPCAPDAVISPARSHELRCATGRTSPQLVYDQSRDTQSKRPQRRWSYDEIYNILTNTW